MTLKTYHYFGHRRPGSVLKRERVSASVQKPYEHRQRKRIDDRLYGWQQRMERLFAAQRY